MTRFTPEPHAAEKGVPPGLEPDLAPPILVVDDQPMNLDAMDAVLAQTGCRVVRAHSADQALLALLEQEFAAIVLDIKMPGMSGLELADLIKARPRSRHVPILFLTAHMFNERDVLRGYGVGAVDYLTKPVHAEILRSKIGVFVELFRKTRELAHVNEALRREVGERERAEGELRVINHELEARVGERTKALERADRRKDEFLAVLGHELRNPLAPILSAIELMQPDASESERQQARDVVRRQVRQMVRLIDDLLDVGRITSDRFELQRSVVNLDTVVSAAVEVSRPAINERVHELSIDLPPQAVPVYVDAARLAQVLANILTNAAKYTPAGGQISVIAEVTLDGLVIRVRDSGMGIPAEMLDRVFELFVRLEDGGGGLGIGLALARQVVHLHGGRIEVTSDGVGKGAEFSIWLPPMALSASAPDEPAAPPTDKGKRQLRVLVVDDNKDAADMMAVMLGRWGYDARSVYEGQGALSVAQDFRPEVVLLDLGLPGMDGYAVADLMRQQSWGSAVRIFAVTGRGQAEDRQRSLAAGFQDHIVKPVVPDKLKALLAEIAN
jgi:signal transduction histidine kinase